MAGREIRKEYFALREAPTPSMSAREIVAPDRSVPESSRFDVNGRFGSLYAYSLPPLPPTLGTVRLPESAVRLEAESKNKRRLKIVS